MRQRHVLDNPVGNVISALVFLSLAVWFHNDFSQLEAGVADPPRLNRYEAFLYHTIGHWPTVILTACAGVYFGVKGAARLLSKPHTSS